MQTCCHFTRQSICIWNK